MKYILTLIAFSFIFITKAQSDEKSEKILNQVSKEIKALNSFYLEFSIQINNTATGENSNEKGKGYVKGDKFNAEVAGNELISNGIKIWTIVHDSEVVYESDADDDDEESINPKKLMTLWETGFKSKYVKEETLNNQKVHVISLYPVNPKEVQYHTITLYIAQGTNELKKAIMKTKDGGTMTYSISKFTKNIDVPADKLIFDARKYPNYQIIKD